MAKYRKPLKGLFAKTEDEALEASTPTPAPTEASSLAAPTPLADEVAEAITRIRQGFDDGRLTREHWETEDYAHFIRRLDVAQTEAFFLKGKLLSEVKDRFFLDNRVGWKTFAEKTLGMNYTTANQYIRVAREFDVTSHQRPDFGFEHYKALLPLDPKARSHLIRELPQISVKELREVVQKELSRTLDGETSDLASRREARQLVRQLVTLRKALQIPPSNELAVREKWQLSAACRDLADQLLDVANRLSARPEREQDVAAQLNSNFGQVFEAELS